MEGYYTNSSGMLMGTLEPHRALRKMRESCGAPRIRMPIGTSHGENLTAARQGSWVTASPTTAGGYTPSAIPQVFRPPPSRTARSFLSLCVCVCVGLFCYWGCAIGLDDTLDRDLAWHLLFSSTVQPCEFLFGALGFVGILDRGFLGKVTRPRDVD